MVVKLKDQIEGEELVSFQHAAKAWLDLFCEVYLIKDAAPYMRVLAYHVLESSQLHGNLSLFNQEGLEKLNDSITS